MVRFRLSFINSYNRININSNMLGMSFICVGFTFFEGVLYILLSRNQPLFLLMYANTTSTANMMMTIMCIGNYLLFDFFHFQKKYTPTPDRAYIPMNIYIGFTLSPKRYAMRRLKPVLNYFSSFTNDDLITFLPSSNMMVRLALFPSAISVIVPSPKTLCLTLSPMSKSAIYLSSLSMPKFNNKNKLLS